MKNLVEQASLWLQSEACRSGNILDRTRAVVSSFRTYVDEEEEEITAKTGLTLPKLNQQIEETYKDIRRILYAFLRGNHQNALALTKKMTLTMKMDKLGSGVPMYKSRENSRFVHLSKEEMFHIPFERRDLVGNQRYSLSGLPCLYLGGSSYICWEELGRKDFNMSNYCGYSLKEEINVFDMLLPTEITENHQISRAVLILACSLAANRDSLFKPEYILPQCVLHSLIHRSHYNHSIFCVRYYSSHLLNGDADYFTPNFSDREFLSRFVNYVFPAASSKCTGVHEELKGIFNQTETVSLVRETLLNPEKLINGIGADIYLR